MSTQGRGIVDTANSHRYLSSTEVTKKKPALKNYLTI